MKAFIGALLFASLNGAVLTGNITENIDFTEISTYGFTTIYNPEQVNPAGQYIGVANRQQFKLESDVINGLGICYTYAYGSPSNSNNGYLKNFYIGASENIEDNNRTWHQVIWLKIEKQFYTIDSLNLDLLFTRPSNSYYVDYNIYFNTSNNLENLYMNEEFYKENFISQVETRCDADIYTDKLYHDNENTNSYDLASFIDESRYKNFTIVITARLNNATTTSIEMGVDTQSMLLNPDMILNATYEQPQVSNNYEVIDIPDLMFTILSMPFSFVSQAFNLTIFGGTPYQINLSALFLGLIGAIIFIVIIKLILQHAG